jgi:uncharacterized membrane protein
MKKKTQTTPAKNFALEKENFKLIIIGCLIILVGYILMAGGKSPDPNVFNEKEIFSFRRITLAPIVVLAGYIFVLYAIMKKNKTQKES